MRVPICLRLAAISAVVALLTLTPGNADAAATNQASALIEQAEQLVPVDPTQALARSRDALSEIARMPTGPESENLRANAVWLEAQALNRLNRLEEARQAIAPVLSQIEKSQPGSIVHAELLYTLSSIFQKEGDVQNSFSGLKGAFSYFERNRDRKGQAKCLVLMASIYRQAGNYDKSIEYYDQAVDLYSGDKFFNLAVYNNRANSYRDMGQNGKARDDFTKSLQIARDLRNPSLISQVLSNLAYSEISEGRFEEARVHLNEALGMAGNSREQMESAYINGVYAFYWFRRGEMQKSAEWMDRAFK